MSKEKSAFPYGKVVLYPLSKLLDEKGKVKALFQTRAIRKELVKKIADTINDDKDLDNPIIVREKDKEVDVLAGVHRVLAFKKKKYKEIPALIIQCNDEQAFKIVARTNLSRENLTDLEKAEIILYAAKNFKLTLDQINKEYGFGFHNKSSLSNLTRCLEKSSKKTLAQWKKGELETAHVKELIYFKKDLQEAYAKKIIDLGWTSAVIEGIVQQHRKKDKAYDQIKKHLTAEMKEGEPKELFIDGVYEERFDFSDLFKEAKVEDVFNSYWNVKESTQPFLDLMDKIKYPYTTAPKEETIPEPELKETKEELWTLFDETYHKKENWWEDKEATYALTKDTNEFHFFKDLEEIIAFIKENSVSRIKADTDLERAIIHDIVLEIQGRKATEEYSPAVREKIPIVETEEEERNLKYLQSLFEAYIKNYDSKLNVMRLDLKKEHAILIKKLLKQKLAEIDNIRQQF